MIQLGLGLALLFVAPNRAMTVLLTGALLGCITLNLDYCCCIFYMLYAMFDFVAGIDPIGLLVQNGMIFSISSSSMFPVLMEIATIIFEPIAIYYVF